MMTNTMQSRFSDNFGRSTQRISNTIILLFYYYYYYYYYYWYSALGPVWTETRAQSGDWYGSGTLHPE